jgi:hypothetical protein
MGSLRRLAGGGPGIARRRGIHLVLAFGAVLLPSLASPAQSAAALVPAACSIQGNVSEYSDGMLFSQTDTIVFNGSGTCSGVFDGLSVTDTAANISVSETHNHVVCVDRAEFRLDGSLTLPSVGGSFAVTVETTTQGATNPAVITTTSQSAVAGVLTVGPNGWAPTWGACNLNGISTFKLQWVVTVPDTSIDSGPSGPTSSGRPSFTYSANVPGSSFQCHMDSAAFSPCPTSGYTSPDLADGAHTFYVRAANPAGQVDPTPASRNFTVDTQAPSVSIDSGPTDPTDDTRPTFGFSSNDGSANFTCSIGDDSADFGPCSGPVTHQPADALAEGSNTFRVKATDAAANASTATRDFVVDTSPPLVVLSGPLTGADAGSVGGGSYKLHVAATDGDPSSPSAERSGVKSIEVLVGGQTKDYAEQSCAAESCPFSRDWTFNTADYPSGAHTVEVVASDQLGNQTVQNLSFSVDTAQPNDVLPCTGSGEPTNFKVYSLGVAFEGIPFTTDLRRCDDPFPGEPVRANYVSYIYGNCVVAPGDGQTPVDEGCAPPLEIQTWPSCERSLADYELEPGVPYPHDDLGLQRGVPAYSFDEGTRVELYTGTSVIVIFGDDPAQLLRAISAIQAESAGSPPGPPSLLGSSTGDLPGAAPGATAGELRCT